MTQQPPFFSTRFSSGEQLLAFLQSEKNSYAAFILERISRSSDDRPDDRPEEPLERHHIQPKHANGPDAEWNIVVLSRAEHAEAHKLLFDCYNNNYDYAALAMMNGLSEDGVKSMRKQNHQNMKTNKRGFYDPDLQRELGSRPKSREPYARNKYIIAALKRGFILEAPNPASQIVIQPDECSSLTEVVNKWIEHPEMADHKQSWVDCSEKEKFYFLTALTRILTGHVDEKTTKALYSVKGWKVLGIFVNKENLKEKTYVNSQRIQERADLERSSSLGTFRD